MLDDFRIKSLRRLALAGGVALALFGSSVSPAAAQAGEGLTAPLTQNRINEFAAECLNCELAFSGLKGTAKPGETPAQYAARLEGYLGALDRLARQVEPLRVIPKLQDQRPENRAIWHKIARAATGLPSAAREARAAWNGQRRGVAGIQAGPKLMAGLLSVQALLNALRDARP